MCVPRVEHQHNTKLESAPMSLIAVAGKVSHINRIASRAERSGGDIEISYDTTLRVNGRHVKMEGDCSWASDNDHVAIVGQEIDGELVPLAIRNDTTGYEHIEEVSSSNGFAILMIVLGVVLIGLIIGIFMIGWGIWLLFKVNREKQAIAEARRMLQGIPRVNPAGQPI